METTNNNNQSTTSAVDDIAYLLKLEALKRFGEEDNNIKRQVEEKARIYMETKREYNRLFYGLSKLIKQSKLYKARESKNIHIDDTHAVNSARELSTNAARISSDQRPTSLNSSILDDCKNQLYNLHAPRKLLAKHQLNFFENRETLKALRLSLDIAENGFEAATLQSIEQLSSEFQPPQSNE